jgi:hypothetical protein
VTTHVFLGPSLPIAHARSLAPDANFHPPAALGDVYRIALDPSVTCICLIDGQFLGAPAVWHKELFFALSRGIRVIGAASMGALRAAEMLPFGMEGVGGVFEAYRDGACTDDDEVAVLFAPSALAFAPCSIALISLRHAVKDAVEQEVLLPGEAERIIAALKELHFARRTWEAVESELAGCGRRDVREVITFLADSRRDLKAQDAISALEALSAPILERSPRVFEETAFWRDFVREHHVGSELPTVDREHFVDYARLRDHEAGAFGTAWIEVLEDNCARLMSLEVDPACTGNELDALRREMRLLGPEQVLAWLQDTGLPPNYLRQWAATSARRKMLQSALARQLIYSLCLVMRRQKVFQAAVDDLERMSQAEVPERLSVDELNSLWQLCSERFGVFDGPPSAIALRKGFVDERSFIAALLREQQAQASPQQSPY